MGFYQTIDFTNKRIGNVTVLHRSENIDLKHKRARWICQCDCGKIFETSSATLKNTTNTNFSCGCKRTKSPNSGKQAENLTNQRFGWLTAIDRNYTYAEENHLKKETFWNCKCDCGRTKVMRAFSLKQGKNPNCGCLGIVHEDLTNKQFGNLLVLKPDFKKSMQARQNNLNYTYWICQCKCGEIVSVTTAYLTTTKNPHCDKCRINFGDDLSGLKFNYLTVIKRDYDYNIEHNVAGTYWKCLCDCGNYTTVRKSALITNSIKSCGCMKSQLQQKSQMIDITGQRFGKLVALEPDFNYPNEHNIKNSGNVIYWKCQCDCGNICSIYGSDLRQGKVNSCSQCIGSQGEKIIQTILDNQQVKYVYNQSYFQDLINPKTNHHLRYDFIILDDNNEVSYLIEYDGYQHFKPVEAWGGEERFLSQQYLDQLKNKYAHDKKLKLIRIPYTHLNKLTYEDLDINTSQFIYKNIKE